MPVVAISGLSIDYAWAEPVRQRSVTPVVLLHEGLGSVEMWRDFPAALAAASGARVLAYSRPGHGRSDPPPGARGVDYMHREAQDVLPALLAALGVADPILAGHSDGGSIALIAAGSGRVAARGLIVLAPHVIVEDLSVASIAHVHAEGDLPRRLARYHADADRLFRAWSGIWLDPAFRAWDITACLEAIGCPVLAIQGSDDPYGTMRQIDLIEAGVSGPFERLALPGCQHTPHRERPEATLAAMAGFIDRAAYRR